MIYFLNNTIAKSSGKRQTMVDKTLHRKLKIEHEPH